MGRQKENFTLANGNVVEVAIVYDLEQHVAFELVEEFLYRIVMIVRALVRAADHLHGHLAVFEHLLVADRRLKQMPMLVDPVLKMEGVQSRPHGFSSFARASAEP